MYLRAKTATRRGSGDAGALIAAARHHLTDGFMAKAERISLQEAKTRLADTTIKVNAQRELAGLDGKGPQVATPPTEPPGQAPDGEAYQK